MKKALFGLLLAFAFIGCAPSRDDLWARDAIRSKVEQGALIVDVRRPAEYDSGHVKGAINVPHDEVKARLAEFGNDPSKPIVVYCGKGGRAAYAKQVLDEEGFRNVWNLGSYNNLVADKNVPVS